MAAVAASLKNSGDNGPRAHRPKVLHVVGARPNFMKIAPVMDALSRRPGVEQRLVHTGQHYDEKMAGIFFEELGLPRPDRDLEVGSGTQAEQTAAVMVGFESGARRGAARRGRRRRRRELDPRGDARGGEGGRFPSRTSRPGCAPSTCTMPEEINRMVTDRLASILLTPSRDARREPPRRKAFPRSGSASWATS